MNVGELIAVLDQFPADARVVVPHFYCSFNDVASVQVKQIRRDAVETPTDAAYEGPNLLDEGPFVRYERAIVIVRDSADG